MTSRFLVYIELIKIFCFLYFNQTINFVTHTKHNLAYFKSITKTVNKIYTFDCNSSKQIEKWVIHTGSILRRSTFLTFHFQMETVKLFYDIPRYSLNIYACCRLIIWKYITISDWFVSLSECCTAYFIGLVNHRTVGQWLLLLLLIPWLIWDGFARIFSTEFHILVYFSTEIYLQPNINVPIHIVFRLKVFASIGIWLTDKANK